MCSPAFSCEPSKPYYTPLVLHRQDIEIAGRAKPRPNQLGSVKMLDVSLVGIDNYSVKMKEDVLCVFPSLCGKQQTPDTISIKVEEDIGGGMPAIG